MSDTEMATPVETGLAGAGPAGTGTGETAPGETGPGETGPTGTAGAGTAGAGPAMPRLTGALEPRGRWQATACSLARAIDVVSTRSAFLLLREACYGTTRFDDFAARAGISEPVAAARLRELVDAGLLTREQYREPGQRSRLAYRLTEKGAGLFPALVALMEWGDRWLTEDGGPIEFRHRDCGEPVQVELRCAAGHRTGPGELDVSSRRAGD